MNKLLLVVALAISTNSFSQEFQGKAYYQTKTTMDLGSWGSKMSEQQKNMMKDRMKSFLEKTFILTFNKSESIYKEEERLAAPGQGGGGMIAMFAGGAAGEIYKDVKEKIYLQENEFFGKKFLIKDDLPILKWKMGTEQKKIGKYICFKATAVRKVDELDWRSMRAPKKPKTSPINPNIIRTLAIFLSLFGKVYINFMLYYLIRFPLNSITCCAICQRSVAFT